MIYSRKYATRRRLPNTVHRPARQAEFTNRGVTGFLRYGR